MTTLEVTEWMDGHVGRETSDSNQGEIKGILENTTFSHRVVIRIEDIDRFVAEETHAATLRGSIDCALLGGKREFEGGTFNMLVATASPSLRVMLYRMPVVGADGALHTVLGNKTIHDDHSDDLRSDIMTLTVAIFGGDVAGPLVATPALGAANVPAIAEARGVIHIRPKTVITSGLSFEAPGSSEIQKLVAIEKFFRFFGANLWELFKGSL